MIPTFMDVAYSNPIEGNEQRGIIIAAVVVLIIIAIVIVYRLKNK